MTTLDAHPVRQEAGNDDLTGPAPTDRAGWVARARAVAAQLLRP